MVRSVVSRIAARSARCALFACAAFALGACEEEGRSAAPGGADAQIAALEGGKPLPEGGAFTIEFPWMGKQSVMCIGDSTERQIAFVDFTDDTVPALGSVAMDAQGKVRGRLRVRAVDLRSGHVLRDQKLQEGAWLDAEEHPDLVLEIQGAERVRPTVWKVHGSWSMRGVEKPVSFLANVRHVGAMANFHDTATVRVKGSFPVTLRDHGVGGEWTGTPAVAATWQVDVVLLGVLAREE